MDLHYLTIGLSMSNPTTPLIHWNKGSAFELDMLRSKPKMQTIHMEMGTDMVLFSMAARTTQMLLSLANMVKPQMHWNWPVVDWMGRAGRAAMRICLAVLGSLVGMGNSVSETYYWKDPMESAAQNPTAQEEKLLSPTSVMLPIQDIQLVTLDWDCDGQSSMERMTNKETILSSCTNPIILSMVYLPSDDEDASSSSEASDLNELEEEEEDQMWEDEKESCSTENNKAMDSGMQEPSLDQSHQESDWSEEENDWSNEDSWDSDSDAEKSKLNEDLWESFCQNDDPYNPLCFALPTKSPKKTHEAKDITGATGGTVTYSVLLGEPGTKKQTSGQRENPCIEQSYHSPVLLEGANEELLESFNNTQKQKRSHVKRVCFSPSVTVHHMVVWSYAHRMARRGSWEEYARDRCRFQRRIAETGAAIGFCMEPKHREKIWAHLQKSNNI